MAPSMVHVVLKVVTTFLLRPTLKRFELEYHYGIWTQELYMVRVWDLTPLGHSNCTLWVSHHQGEE